MNKILDNEPVAVINAMTTVVEAGLALGVAFGLGLNAQQVGAVMAFVVAISAVLRIMLVRSRVTPLTNPHDNAGHPLVPTASAANPVNRVLGPEIPA